MNFSLFEGRFTAKVFIAFLDRLLRQHAGHRSVGNRLPATARMWPPTADPSAEPRVRKMTRMAHREASGEARPRRPRQPPGRSARERVEVANVAVRLGDRVLRERVRVVPERVQRPRDVLLGNELVSVGLQVRAPARIVGIDRQDA